MRNSSRTRGAEEGLLRMPKDKRNVLMCNMVAIWNGFPALRAAKTLSMARSVARKEIWSNQPGM